MLEVLDKIASILSSLTIIVGSIIVALSFRYKFDSEVRNLYIENCEKICNALDEIIRTGRVSNDVERQVTIAFLDAEIYLHANIVDFTKDIRDKIIELQCIEFELRDLPVGEERSKKCYKGGELKIYLNNRRREARNFYRKYIIQESIWDKFSAWFKKQAKESFILRFLVK